jgi:hypothetical protein
MLVVSELKILHKGLQYAGFSNRRQKRVKHETNMERFRSFYGSDPVVYAKILDDLIFTDIPAASIAGNDEVTLKHYLMAIHWLKCYRTETVQSGQFGFCEITCRKYAWYFAERIQALKDQKVCYESAS